MMPFDTIILGAGLAGTTLAWALRSLGVRVLVIDRGDEITSSRIAAGLITPITGQRLALSWRFPQLWPAATAFYHACEATTQTTFFRVGPMVRLFSHDAEYRDLDKKRDTAFQGLIAQPEPLVNADWFDAPYGGFEMAPSARLQVAKYLDASRLHFQNEGLHQTADIDLATDIVLTPTGVTIPCLNVSASRLVFCQGFAGANNPWFPQVRFRAVKGEILTLRIPQMDEVRTINRHGSWLAPIGNGLFRAGATYDRVNLDQVPTAAGQDAILASIRQFVKLPFEVVDHNAAVRPIIRVSRPVLGVHATLPQLAYFNGLGSKGSLGAPYFAKHFAEHLVHGTPLEPEVDFRELPQFPA